MPAITEIQGFDVLMKEYENGEEILRTKLKKLASTHEGFRSVKKDGNCFFRAFGYRGCLEDIGGFRGKGSKSLRPHFRGIIGLAELIWEHNGDEWGQFATSKATGTKSMLVDVGYELGAIEDFYDTFMETLQRQEDSANLLQIFQGYASDTVVCHLRLCTAAELKRNKDLYEGFSEIPLPDLIAQSVEPMYVEVRLELTLLD
jgi:ubiquitin thioesterase protein OTUB1